MSDFTSIAHLTFSVTNAEASAGWYERVLGAVRLRRFDLDDRIMIMLGHGASGINIVLNQHRGTGAGPFDEHRVGLDHVSFAVPGRSDLDALEQRLAEFGVEHSPVTDSPSGSGSALVFRDPDNIQLEFWWTRPRDH